MNRAIKRRQRARTEWRWRCTAGKDTNRAWANYLKVKDDTKGQYWIDVKKKKNEMGDTGG